MGKSTLLLMIIAFSGMFNCMGQDLALNGEESSRQKILLLSGETNSNGVISQWEFSLPQIKVDTLQYGSHRLGKNVAVRKDYFLELYTRLESIAPGNPSTKVVITKPAIFNAVKQIEKYYLGRLKANTIGMEGAELGFVHVLEVAIAAATENSDSFEVALQQNKKDVIKIVGLFESVNLVKM